MPESWPYLTVALICLFGAGFCLYAKIRTTSPFWNGVFEGAFWAYLVGIVLAAIGASYA